MTARKIEFLLRMDLERSRRRFSRNEASMASGDDDDII